MTSVRRYEAHDSFCGAKKRQPTYPGETCRRPAGWATRHPGFARCKLHGGATPYRHGRYSTIMRDVILPDLRSKMGVYFIVELRTAVANLIPDVARREELVRFIVKEWGLSQTTRTWDERTCQRTHECLVPWE